MNENNTETPPLPGGFISVHEKLPPVGRLVIVTRIGHRGLGYLDAQGVWRDEARDAEMRFIFGWQELFATESKS